MAKKQFCFVQTLPVGRSKRDHELEQAKARSHAASVAHKRDKINRRTENQSVALLDTKEPSVQSTNQLWLQVRLPVKRLSHVRPGSVVSSDESYFEDDSDAYTNDPTYSARVHEQLDPFLRLAGTTTSHERNLLHFYLVVSPAAVYGVRPGALHCPVRDTTVHNIQTNNVWLQWTLLSAEMSARGPSIAEKTVTTLSRRSQIYRYMNQLISDPDTRFSDYTITGLNFAGLVESRLGSLSSARKHLAAVRNLIPNRGGIQALPMEISLPTCCIWIWVGLGSHAFSNLMALETAIDKFRGIMLGIQQWAPSLLDPVDDQEGPDNRLSSAWLSKYLLARLRIFSPFSPLHRFIGPSCFEDADNQIRSHAALLWVINKVLYELRDDYKQSTGFLDTLHRYIESADEFSPTEAVAAVKGFEQSSLKTLTIIGILGRVAELYLPNKSDEEVYGVYCPQEKNRSILRWWEAVDMLELLHVLSSESRDRVLRQLSGWLIGSELPDNVERISEVELEDLANEMRHAWLSTEGPLWT